MTGINHAAIQGAKVQVSPDYTADHVIANSTITEAMQLLADNTTGNVSTSAHGYAPKAPNDATKYLDGTGAYSVPSSGGLALSFAGYNTVGGTWTALTNLRYYTKQIVLSKTTLISSIDVYLRDNADNFAVQTQGLVLADNSGSPGALIAGNSLTNLYLSIAASTPGPGGWRSIPVSVQLASGTYWIGFMIGTGASNYDIANDGSGSDVTWTSSAQPYLMGAYPAAFSLSVGAVKYSIRASVLS